MAIRSVTYCLALSLACAPLARAQGQAPDDATRATMREIFAALSEILPRCLSEERFEAPGEREVVRGQLARIAERADALAAHAGGADKDLAARGSVLADDARRASARFASGRYVDARFVALHLTESCVGCHSRLPSDKDSPFAAKLVNDAKLGDLSASERARLAVATRQFDQSLDLYESLLTSPPPADGEVTRGADLVEYLIVAVRVKRDPERAARLLDRLAKRPETAPDVRRELGPWAATLRSEGKALREKPSLARARALVEAGRRARPYGFSRAGLADDLLASSILHALLEDPGQPTAERAETYYLLGLTDAQVRASPWLSDASWYLASAIRTAPHTAVAQRAFDAYEDMTLLSWSGSAGTELPPDVVAELDRLRALAGAKK
ncbi:MAG TPA: hypothetical protein VMR86_18390 [Myxococcota bacterium]|nr:hypothetical protein [Myxococcota bacterium]